MALCRIVIYILDKMRCHCAGICAAIADEEQQAAFDIWDFGIG